jgi:hypothetical protein
MMLKNILAGALVLVALQVAGGVAAAEKYPIKPIRIIVPSAPSSGPDVIARLIGNRFTDAWGEQVVADARPGSAGNVARRPRWLYAAGGHIAADQQSALAGEGAFRSHPRFFTGLSDRDGFLCADCASNRAG